MIHRRASEALQRAPSSMTAAFDLTLHDANVPLPATYAYNSPYPLSPRDHQSRMGNESVTAATTAAQQRKATWKQQVRLQELGQMAR